MDQLRSFYDDKYSSEGDPGPLAPPAPLTRHPRDRFQATVHYLHRYFTGGSILELGAGSGFVARSLRETDLPFDRYVLTEGSQSRLRGMARSLGKDPRFEVREVDAERIPEDIETFDCVIMIALIEHLLDPLAAMSRVKEVLNPGGFVYVDTPNIAKITRRVKLAFGWFPATASRKEGLTTYEGQPVGLHDEGHLHYFTFRSLDAMLTTRCGFSRTVRAPYFIDRWLPGRLGNGLARLWPALFSELALLVYR